MRGIAAFYSLPGKQSRHLELWRPGCSASSILLTINLQSALKTFPTSVWRLYQTPPSLFPLSYNGRVLVTGQVHIGSTWQPDYFVDGATWVQMCTKALSPISKA
jgi:hypothetical protein